MEQLNCVSRVAWRTWLEANHATKSHVWLVHHRQHGGNESVSHQDALEEVLCFGWIDGLSREIDVDTYVQRYSRRVGNNTWSELNKRSAENMIDQGLMAEAGLAKINEAKKSGHWDKTLHSDSLGIPADLEKAFAADRTAWISFRKLPPWDQRQLVRLVTTAKNPRTRQQRIKQAIMFAMQRRNATDE